MGITAKGGSDFKPIPEGMYQGVCYMVFDLGTQFNEQFNNKSRKVLVGWEVPDERIEIDGGVKPTVISKRYTLSLNEKAILRKDLESWRSKKFTKEELNGFDISNLIGANCNLQILHNEYNGKTYANIATITPLMKNQTKLDLEGETVYFSFEDNTEFPDNTPEWIKTIAMKSDEYGYKHETVEEPPPYDDDIPF